MIWVVALFWSLVHSLWQGSFLHACGWVITREVRSASRRYLLLVAAQLSLVPLFVWTFVRELGAAGAAAPPASLVLASGAPAASQELMAWTVAAWGCGLASMLARLARGVQSLAGLRRRAEPLGGAWQELAARGAARLGIRRRVALREAAGVDSPLALGWLKPVILMPLGWAAQLPPRVVEAAILHELVHIRRHDFPVNVAQHAVESLFFYHPGVWWLSRQVRQDRELCCDERVVAAHVEPLEYAGALVALEEHRRRQAQAPLSALSLAAARGSLTERVEHVLGVGAQRHPRRGVGAAVAALVLAFLVVLGACLRDTDGEPPALAQVAAPDVTAPLAAPWRPRWLPSTVARFAGAIEAAAAAHAVDPALLAVMVLVESRGSPEAVSPRGALGLMQLMPETAARIASQRGLPSPTASELTDPAYNLDFAAFYVAQQLERFADRPETERVELAALAYNGGPHLLNEHLAGRAQLWSETVRYSRLVTELWSDREADSSEAYRALAAAP